MGDERYRNKKERCIAEGKHCVETYRNKGEQAFGNGIICCSSCHGKCRDAPRDGMFEDCEIV